MQDGIQLEFLRQGCFARCPIQAETGWMDRENEI